MRLGWSIPLPGPLRLSGTVWRSKRRRSGYHGTLPGWKCPHNHPRQDLALACAQRETRRREAAQPRNAVLQRAAGRLREAAALLRKSGRSDPTGALTQMADVLVQNALLLVPGNAAEIAGYVRRIAGTLRENVKDDTGSVPELAGTLMDVADIIAQQQS